MICNLHGFEYGFFSFSLPCVCFKKIGNSEGEALRDICRTVKRKTTCLLYYTLFCVLIFIVSEEFRLKFLIKEGNTENYKYFLFILENTYNRNSLLSK